MTGGFFSVIDRVRHRARLKRWNESAALGRRGEDLAHRYLQAIGLTVVERNWVGPGLRAEVDLIAWDGDTLVFVEVKSRHNLQHAAPDRAMDTLKRRQVASAAHYFLKRWRIPPSRARFDLVTIVFEPFHLEHTRAAWSFDPPNPLC